jgi:hypothetical protein
MEGSTWWKCGNDCCRNLQMVVVACRRPVPTLGSHPTQVLIIMDRDLHQNSAPTRSAHPQNHLLDPVDPVALLRPPINLQNTCGIASGLPLATLSDRWLSTIYPHTTPLLSRHSSHPLFQHQRHCHADPHRPEWSLPLRSTEPLLLSGYPRVPRPPSPANLEVNSNSKRYHLQNILGTILQDQLSYALRNGPSLRRVHAPVWTGHTVVLG